MKTLSERKENLTIFMIFFLALFARIAYWIFLRKNYFFYGHPGGDVVYYAAWAKEIAYNNWIGKETFFGLPLYPYCLAIIDIITGGKEEGIRFFHVLLGSINCILTYKASRKMFSEPVAILASLLCALNFSLIYYDWLMMPVTLIIFLSLCVILSLISCERSPSPKHLFSPRSFNWNNNIRGRKIPDL